ncbi:unnamed protein product [Caenorhabditis brenneri]
MVKFLDACPHLDPTRALELLSELPLAEAIKRGMEIIMTPKEHVPRWVKQQLGDPTDLRIREIVEGRVAAENPQEVETAYIKVEWPEAVVAARLRAARLDARRKQKDSSAQVECKESSKESQKVKEAML